MSPSTVPSPSASDRPGVGKRLRFLLETYHVTVPQLAGILSTRRESIQEIVDGMAEPSSHTLKSIARYFEVDIEYFYDTKVDKPRDADSQLGKRSRSVKNMPDSLESLTLNNLAVRHQGLVELLIEKGVLSAAEYNDRIRRVEERSK